MFHWLVKAAWSSPGFSGNRRLAVERADTSEAAAAVALLEAFVAAVEAVLADVLAALADPAAAVAELAALVACVLAVAA